METTSKNSHQHTIQTSNTGTVSKTIKPNSSEFLEHNNTDEITTSVLDNEVAFELGELGFDKYGNLVKW
jgi:hypothetical protein